MGLFARADGGDPGRNTSKRRAWLLSEGQDGVGEPAQESASGAGPAVVVLSHAMQLPKWRPQCWEGGRVRTTHSAAMGAADAGVGRPEW